MIISLYFQRMEDAIVQTQKKYGAYCYSIAMNLLNLREDAEECCNDTYLTAWNRIPPDQPNRLAAYLGRITRNIAVSLFRARHAQKRYSAMEVLLSELDDCVPSPQTPEMVVEGKELAGYIDQWLDGLTTSDRALFVRRYWYGDAVQTLAKETGELPNRVSKRLQKMRKSLKEYLESKGVAI